AAHGSHPPGAGPRGRRVEHPPGPRRARSGALPERGGRDREPWPAGAGADEHRRELGALHRFRPHHAVGRQARRSRADPGARHRTRHGGRRARARGRAVLPGQPVRPVGLRPRACHRARVGRGDGRNARPRVGARRRDDGRHPAAGGAGGRGGARVLVVDDEPALVDAVGYARRSEGFDVETAQDGEQALQALSHDEVELVVLDIMLPRLSGIEVCRRMREASDVPIILLSARDAEVDRVLGLESGADDYVTKPFSMAELLSRVRAVLRRRELDLRATGSAVMRISRLEIDPVRHTVKVDGRPVRLTPSEFKLLALLAGEPERVFTRREVMQHLWDSTYVGDQRACDIHMSNLRRKVERDPESPEQLVTVRGVGYKLVAVWGGGPTTPEKRTTPLPTGLGHRLMDPQDTRPHSQPPMT